MAAFTNNVFVQAYAETTQDSLVVDMFQNGQSLPGFPTGFVTHLGNNSNPVHHVGVCTYNNDAMVVWDYYNATDQAAVIYARLVDRNGNFYGPEIQIPGTVGLVSTLVYCEQVEPNQIMIHYDVWNQNTTGTQWDTFFVNYNPQTQVFGTVVLVNSDNTGGNQAYQQITQLSTGNIMLSLCIEQNGFDMYEIDTNNYTIVGGAGTSITTSGTQNRYQRMASLSGGRFIITYGDTANYFYQVLEQNLTNVCNETRIYNSTGLKSDLVVSDDIAYIVVYSTIPTQQVVGITLNPLTCNVQSTEVIHQGVIQTNTLSVAISQDTDSVQSKIIAVTFITTGPPRQLILYEFLISQEDGMGNQIQCPDQRCRGCYGSYTCPTCIGSDNAQKIIRKDGANTCTCNDGFYDDFPNNIDCQPCQFPCANCLNSTQCITCQTTDANMDANCQCNFGWSRLNTDTLCSQCSNRCADCVGDVNTCGNCSHASRTEAGCNCPAGTYDDGVNGPCIDCIYPCENCSGGPSTCTSCQTTPSFRVSTTDCSCQQGYYEIGSECGQCESQCLGCTGSPQNCTERCDRRCGSCSGTVDNCSVTCNTDCLECDSSGDCTNCGIGQYLEDKQCLQCNFKCLTCQNSNICLLCAIGENRNMDISSQCGCIDGYYNIGQLDCVKCPLQNCQICDNNGQCLQCQNQQLDPSQDCLEWKKSNMIIRNGQLLAGQCDIQCISCQDSKDNCTQCIQGLYRDQNKPCKCLKGYHDENGTQQDCQKCHYSCDLCTDSLKCTTCNKEDQRILNIQSGLCQCKNGYKENPITKICEKCFKLSNMECVLECPKNTQQDYKLYFCLENELQKQQNKILVLICGSFLILFIILLWSICIVFKTNNQHNKWVDIRKMNRKN